MFPSASAKRVLLEEFVWSSMMSTYSRRFVALVRDVGLDEGAHGLLHEGHGHPLPVRLPHDGPVVGPIDRELPLGHPVSVL